MENYKQKYEAAIKQAKKELEACGSLDCDAARQVFRLFPELQSIKNEKIKTNIIKLLRFVRDTHHQYFDECNEAIEWLKKQSDAIICLEDNWIREELIHFLETCQDTRLVGNRKRDKWIEWLEKQGEQKQVSITDEWIEDYWQHEKVNNPNSYDKGDEIQFDHDGFIRFCKDIANRQKEQTINKARKWLAGNVINYIWKGSGGGIGIRDDFFIDFEKAMEE